MEQLKREQEWTDQRIAVDQDQKQRLDRMEKLHVQLKQWRQERMRQMQLVAEQQERAMQQERIWLKTIQEQEEMARLDNKVKIQAYHEHLALQRKKQQEVATQLAFKEQAEKIIQKKVNWLM